MILHYGNESRNVAIYICRVLRKDTLIEPGHAYGMTGYSPAGSAVERVKKETVQGQKAAEEDRKD